MFHTRVELDLNRHLWKFPICRGKSVLGYLAGVQSLQVCDLAKATVELQ